MMMMMMMKKKKKKKKCAGLVPETLELLDTLLWLSA